MSHINIALINYETVDTDLENQHPLYLCIIKDEKWMFWEYKDNAIGASFRRDEFEYKLRKGLNLNTDHVQFDKLGSKEYIDDSSPSSTAYNVKLVINALEDVTIINETLSQKSITYEWCDYKICLSRKDNWLNHQKYIFDEGQFAHKATIFSKSFLATVESILNARNESRLVMLVGSGISKNSGIPTWPELIQEIRNSVDIPADEADSAIIAQVLFNSWGTARYYEFLEKFITPKAVPNSIHKEILILNPNHILTTNFDNLIEVADQKYQSSYGVISNDGDFPKTRSGRYIVKVHGDLKCRNIVFKEDDYLNYEMNFPLIESFIKSVFASKVVLIVGFSFNDINLKFILEKVRYILRSDSIKPVLFLTESSDKIDIAKLEYYKSRGLEILSFESNISHYLNKRHIQTDLTDSKGRNTFEFLKFLNIYTREVDNFENSNVIDQLDKARLRFSEFRSVPSKFFNRIRPFALSSDENDQAKYVALGFHLQTRNEDIIRLLKKFKVPDSTEINIDKRSTENTEYSNIQIEQLKDVFRWLNSSSIRCIQLKDSISSDNHNRIDVKRPHCDCPTCKFMRYDILGALNSLSIDPRDDYSNINNNWTLINYALAYSFFGEYLTSYSLLKQAANNSRSNGNSIIYFFSLYNLKRLYPFIHSLDIPAQISAKQRDVILNEIKEIYPDQIIAELPINNFEKEILVSILHEKTRQELEWKIDEVIDELIKIKRIFINDGESIGPNYFLQLYYLYKTYYLETLGNCLVSSLRGEFQINTTKLFKATLLNYTISSKYQHRIKSIEVFIFKCVTLFSDPSTLLKLLQEFEFPELLLDESESESYYNACLSLFGSTWKKGLFNDPYIPPEILAQKSISFIFDQRLRYYIANTILLLSTTNFNISDEQKSVLIDNIVNYLNTEQLRFESQYFSILIQKKIDWFNDKQIDVLIQSIFKKPHVWDRYLEMIVNAINTHHTQYSLNEGKANLILSELKSKMDIKALIVIFNIIPDSLRNAVKLFVREFFNAKGITYENYDEFYEAIFYNLVSLNDDDYLDKYINSRRSSLIEAKIVPKSYGFGFDPGEATLFIDMIHHAAVTKTALFNSLLESSEITPEFRWALSPDTFDYSKFNTEWIIALKDTSLVKRTLKNKRIPALIKIIKNDLIHSYSKDLWLATKNIVK